MIDQSPPAQAGGLKDAADILGIRELPSMTVLVTAIAQPFAQLAARFDLPHLPLVVAAVVSLLFAIYNTSTARKVPARDCLVLVPLITLALFATSLGANNIISAAVRPGAEAAPAALTAQLENTAQQLRLANEQLALKQKQIELQDEAIKALSKRPGGTADAKDPRSPSGSQHSSVSVEGILSTALELVARPAFAQAPPPRSPTPAPGVSRNLEQVRKLEAETRRLEEEQRRLAEEQQKLQDAAARRQQSMPEQQRQQLWRAW
jgi:hypothetical protein